MGGRRSNPDSTTLIVVLLLAGVGGAAFLNSQKKGTGTTGGTGDKGTDSPGSGGQGGGPNKFIAPSDLKQRMLNGYAYKRRETGINSPTRAEWIEWVQDTVFHLPSPVWGYVYDQGVGWSIQHGGQLAGESDLEAWLNFAANDASYNR